MLQVYMLQLESSFFLFFFFQAEDGIRDYKVTGVQTCALPISAARSSFGLAPTASSTRSAGSDVPSASPTFATRPPPPIAASRAPSRTSTPPRRWDSFLKTEITAEVSRFLYRSPASPTFAFRPPPP